MLVAQMGLVLGDTASDALAQDAAFLFLKLLFIIAGLLYVVFAVIVTRQISIMKKTLITTFSPMIQLVGFIHLAVAIIVLLYFFML